MKMDGWDAATASTPTYQKVPVFLQPPEENDYSQQALLKPD